MEDQKIVELFEARNEEALDACKKKYDRFCFHIADRILCCREDAEEIVNDTYLKAWNTIPPKRPNIFKMFLAKITRNLAFSRWRSNTAAKRGGGELELVLEELNGCIAAPGGVEDRMNARDLALAIRAFLNTISAREQDIFLRRYFFVEESTQIARRYGMKPAAVLRSLSRTREKLKRYLAQEGYAV